ncbi:MAG: two-component regulator propeller domain-containing protein [Bacteroidota bacterium]
MHSPINRTVIVALFLFMPLFVRPQGQNHFEHLTIKNGLSHSVVYSIVQDKKGFMWFGTGDGGLNKYDGYHFTVFENDPSDENSLASNNVSKVLCDRSGNIWIGTWGSGLDKYDPVKEQFTHYKFDSSCQSCLSHNNAQTLLEDKSGNIWIGTSGGGLNKLDPVTGKFTVFRNDENDSASLSNDRVWSVAEDKYGNIWVGTSEGLNKLDVKTGKFKRYLAGNGKGQLSHPKVRAIHIDRFNNIWVGTTGGLDLLNDDGTFTNYKPQPGNVETSEVNEVNVIYSDKKGGMWVGTHAGGLFYFHSLKKVFTCYKHNPNDENSISYNDVRDIVEDRSGILWISTRGEGVNKLDLKPAKFMHYSANYQDQSLLLGNRVRAICSAGNDAVWLGLDGAGLSCFNLKDGNFKNYVSNENDPNSISGNRIRAVYQDDDGRVFIGTEGSGLNVLDNRSGKMKKYFSNPDDPRTLTDNDIRCISKALDGKIWIGTDNGVDQFDPLSEEFSHWEYYGSDSAILPSYRILCIYTDSKGLTWIGTEAGLACYNSASQQMKVYLAEAGKQFVLSNNFIYCITEDKYHNMWIGTGRGLNHFDRNTERFTFYTDKHGLPGNSVYSIQEADNGNLWISTINGLAKFDPDKKSFRNYFSHDGLQSNEFLPGSGVTLQNGYMFFGGINGFNVFHPDKVRENEYLPQIVFTGFSIFNKPIYPGEDSPLENSVTYTDKIVLSYDQDVISISFAALSYNVPEENQYAYKMEGFDDDWVMTGTKREASYTNLSPGTYTFRVKASNNDGKWNEEGISMTIIITPPFWQTAWFYILCAVVLLILLFIFIKWREKKLTSANRVLEEKVQQRTEKINQQNKVLNQQREELEHKHRDIMDSIKYAKRIQEAILPPRHIVEQNIKEHFVLYKPKDIVSGDFYWTEEHNGMVLVAAVDCTGHGVPGAFVSIVGNNGLNRAVNEFNLTRPAAILDKLNKLVVESLHQGETEMKDGMDLALCCIDRENKKVQFSGANNSLYVISKKVQAAEENVVLSLSDNRYMYELKADKQPIGGIGYKHVPFTNHEIEMENGDMIYLFTDGFADQFGGPKGKKFKYSNLFKLLADISLMPMEEQRQKLNAAFENWKKDLEQIDDVCIIGVRL